jgi:hypothetical protein
MVLVNQRRSAACGTRYNEGEALPGGGVCDCGTYAIGRCKECGVEVCGDHSILQDRRRLCTKCWEDESARVAERIANARYTIPRFLSAAAEAGWPGLKTWFLTTQVQVAQDPPRGRFRKVPAIPRTEVQEHAISGWLLQFDAGKYMLSQDGEINRCDRSFWTGDPRDEQRARSGIPPLKKDFRWSDHIPQHAVELAWGTRGVGLAHIWTPERIDIALRTLGSEIGVSL